MQFEFFHAYLICFLVGFVYAVVSAVLSGVLGGDIGGHDVDLSGGHDASFGTESGMVHFSPLSPTILATFLTGFGGAGIICLKVFNMSNYTSIPVSVIVALILAALVFLMMEWVFSKTESTVSVDAAQLVGMHADVITPIPENGVGEIAFVTSGLRQNAPARSADGKPIPSPSEVEVVRVVGNSYIVRRVEHPESASPASKSKL